MSIGSAHRSIWEENASAVALAWAGDGASLEVRRTPRQADHLLGTLHGMDGSRWFVKAFAPGHDRYFECELDVYRAAPAGSAPLLRHVELDNRVLITEECGGGRLGDLDSISQASLLNGVAPLFGKLLDLPAGFELKQDRESFHVARAAVSAHPIASALPSADVVLELLSTQEPRRIHGDFHPLNVLVDDGALHAIDFESYGDDLPGFDIVRMAFNPSLQIDTGQRLELMRELSAMLGADRRPTDRELAACCVYWGVSCAAYFSSVLAADPEGAQHSPEVPVLATEPLVQAAKFWNGEL